MKISSYILSILCLLSFNLKGQSVQLLKAEGKIPKEFITPSTKKYKKQVKELTDKKSKTKNKKNKKQFLLESNFAVDDILQSGMVLFNDPATVYVNEVLKNLPFDDRKLVRKKPRAYVLNSGAVNAFATDQGIIFVTLGLLANLENEAQLAFILAHELVHVKHQHAVDKFIKSKDIDKESRNINKVAVDRNMFKKSMYSRHLEEEADEEGLALFLKSDYDPEVILNTFKILYYSYLPFDEVEMKRSIFEDQHYILPKKLWLDTLNTISPMVEDAEEEKKSSHPSSSKRMAKLKDKIVGLDNAGKKAFILPKNRFSTIQKRAKYQIPFLNLYAENFAEAIYTSHLMLQEFPDDLELKKVIAKSLYMVAKYKNHKEFDSEIKFFIKPKDFTVEGASHQIYNLLTEIDSKELSILALKYNWSLIQLSDDDKEVSVMLDDMFVEFAKHFDSLAEFENTTKVTKPAKTTKPAKEVEKSDEEKTKLEKIEEKTAEKSVEDDAYWAKAFVSEVKDKSFVEHYEKGLKELENREEDTDFYKSSEGRKAWAKRRKKENKRGKSLGIKKVVVVNPFYLSVDARRNKGIQYIRSEEKQTYFSKAIEKYSGLTKVKTEVLDISDFSQKNIKEFNEVAEVNHYFSQQMNHFDLSLTQGYNQNEIDAIAEKYGTEYFLWTGVISLRQKTQWSSLATGLLAPYVLPILIPVVLSPDYDMLYYAILFDVKTSRRSVLKMDYFDKKDSKAILNAHIYDVFHQIGK